MTTSERSQSGLSALKRRVSARGMDAVDKRSASYRAVKEWRAELLDALGGEVNVTPQRMAIVDLLVRTRLYLNHIDAYLMEQPSLINRKRKAILPILRERMQLADGLSRLLQQIGLDRVAIEGGNAIRIEWIEKSPNADEHAES